MTPVLIVLNAGSSSLKFQVFETPDGAEPRLVFKGLFEGLGGRGAFRRQGRGRGNPRRDDVEFRRPDRARGGADASHLVAAPASGGAQARGHRAPGRPWRRGLFRPGARRRLRRPDPLKPWCRSRPCISPITWSRSGSCAGACRGCRRSPASTRPSTRASPRSRACSPCRARCGSAACGATASTGCPTTTSRPS